MTSHDQLDSGLRRNDEQANHPSFQRKLESSAVWEELSPRFIEKIQNPFETGYFRSVSFCGGLRVTPEAENRIKQLNPRLLDKDPDLSGL